MKPLVSCLSFALAVTLHSVVFAQSDSNFIHVDEIRPGMKGYGLTVFRGTEPERFDVEVIDVLRDFRPDQDMILIRTPHPLLDRARGVAGMSGSPIYIEGRLAGAYAYGWSYGTDPVVGVTPIKNMHAELGRPVHLEQFPGAKASGTREMASSQAPPNEARLAGLPPYSGEGRATAFSALEQVRKNERLVPKPVGLELASTPIMLGGFTDSVAQMLGERLQTLGLVPTQAGVGSAGAQLGASQFEPGGAIAVELARGDISVTGIGTVTHVEKDGRVLAFGHPMLNTGISGLPTATARVLHILVSEARSFKIAESGRSLGTLVQDRQSAIIVDTNMQAARIPVRVRIRGVEGAPKTEWNVEVASHRLVTPVISYAVINNALKSSAGTVGDAIFRVKSTVGIEGHEPVTLHEQGFSPMGVADPAALAQLGMFSLMEIAYANPFEASRITSLDVELDVEFSREVYQIVDVSVSHDEVDPGTEVTAYVRLRRVGHEDTIKTIRLQVPEAAAGNKVKLLVSAGDEVPIEQPRAASLEDLIDQVRERYPATSMVAALQMPSRGLRFRGQVVDALPDSALNTLQLLSTSEDTRPFVTQVRSEMPLSQVVVGKAGIELRVREVARARLRGDK